MRTHIKTVSDRAIIRAIRSIIAKHGELQLSEVACHLIDDNNWYFGFPASPNVTQDEHDIKVMTTKIRSVSSSIRTLGEYMGLYELKSMHGITLDDVKTAQRMMTFIAEDKVSSVVNEKRVQKGFDSVSTLISIANQDKKPVKTQEDIEAETLASESAMG